MKLRKRGTYLELGTWNVEQLIIRLATLDDAAPMLEIYAPLVAETAVTFEFEAPTLQQFKARMAEIQARYPWLVSDRNGRIAGFAYAGPHRARPAYQWSVEVSVYVHTDFRRLGVARTLYLKLLELLRTQGYHSAYAGITLPNDASEALHRSVGFEPVGVYKAAGFKLGRWHGAVWYQRQINDRLPDDPTPPLRPHDASVVAAWSRLLRYQRP
ncbi:MAG TPA: GNAT family N-acetyltransferase [Rhodothermia bacterium]